MPIPNPVYGLMVPFLCVVTLPLAILAGVTTTLAFSVLMFRVMVVYLDIALSIVPQYLMGRSSNTQGLSQTEAASRPHGHYIFQQGSQSPKSLVPGDGTGFGTGHDSPPLLLPASLSTGHRSPTRNSPHAHFASAPSSVISPSAGRRSRRGSLGGASAVASSVGTITPVREEDGSAAMSQETGFGSSGNWSGGGAGASSFMLLKDLSGGGNNPAIVRDFEGVGGWRLASENKGEDDDDSDWANINSRLELPLERMRQQQQNQHQNHHRTGSGHSGTVTPGDGSWLMMKNHRSRGSESLSVGTEIERENTWGSGGLHTGPSSGRPSVSPNSSRVRIGQGVAARSESYFPPTAPTKSARKTA